MGSNILSRILTSRGHGVHSPFAYWFITDVLTERLPYYAYDDIRFLLEERGMLRGHNEPLARLLFRIIVGLRPSRVITCGAKALQFEPVTDIAMDNLAGTNGTAPLVFITDLDMNSSKGFIESAGEMDDGFCLVVDRKSVGRNYKTAADVLDILGIRAPFGMSFCSPRFMVLTLFPHLPRQDFHLNF